MPHTLAQAQRLPHAVAIVQGPAAHTVIITPHTSRYVICGARTHAELPPVDLKSTPLTTRAK